MNGTDFKNNADDAVKIYVPRSFSGVAADLGLTAAESDEVKIYSRKGGESSQKGRLSLESTDS